MTQIRQADDHARVTGGRVRARVLSGGEAERGCGTWAGAVVIWAGGAWRLAAAACGSGPLNVPQLEAEGACWAWRFAAALLLWPAAQPPILPDAAVLPPDARRRAQMLVQAQWPAPHNSEL